MPDSTQVSVPVASNEPSDEELLKTFRSRYAGMDPNTRIQVQGLSGPRELIGTLIQREKEIFLEQQRVHWRQARAQKEAELQRAAGKALALERAQHGVAREALQAAAAAYRAWQTRLTQLDSEITAQATRERDLLDDPAGSPTALADCSGLVAALRAKRISFAATEPDALDPLKSALQAARHEFSTLYQGERERRVERNLELLRIHLDFQTLGERLNIWGDWRSLAECFANITALDVAGEYRNGRFWWRDYADLEAAREIEQRFGNLEKEIYRLQNTPKKAVVSNPTQKR